MPAIAVFVDRFSAVRHHRQRIDQRAELLALASHAAAPASLRQGQFLLLEDARFQADCHLTSIIPFGAAYRWLSPPSTASVCPVTKSDAFRK